MSDAWAGEHGRVAAGGDSYRLFVRDGGPRTNLAILFLHGFSTRSLDRRKIAPRFAEPRDLLRSDRLRSL